MGRGGWMKTVAFLLAVVTASCGGTGGGSSGSGQTFVFQTRGRLNLVAQVVNQSAINGSSIDPTVLRIIATLLDPQGNPFRNQRVTFEAEFPDATIVPNTTLTTNIDQSLACLPRPSNGNATRCTNRGAAITDDFGQAQVTLIAGLTLGRMRLIAEAPANLNISSAISVEITNQGFIGGTALAILPTAATFVNPMISPGTDGPFTIFNAVGGTPPYQWDHTNDSLGEITPGGIPNINQQATYTLTGPIPTNSEGVLTDTVILTDSKGTRVTATVTVIFADCDLTLSADEVDFTGATGGESFEITITNGVPPFTATHTFPAAGTLLVNNTNGIVTYTIATPPFPVDPDNVLIRDSRGCMGTVDVTIEPAAVATLTLAANPTSIVGAAGGNVTITALAFDGNNQPFAGTTLLFSTTGGTLTPTSATTDATGKATVTLTIPAGTAAGSVTVTVTAPGGATATVTDTVT